LLAFLQNSAAGAEVVAKARTDNGIEKIDLKNTKPPIILTA